MVRFLVTGGAGFIGSNLVERLLAEDHDVRVLDDFSTGRWENLEARNGRIEILEGDLRNPGDVAAAVEGVDYVLHQGAIASVTRSVADPEGTHEVNVTGTQRVLEAALEAGVKRVVLASSSAIYGDREGAPRHEDEPPHPVSPYGAQKLAAEELCAEFTRRHGLETVCLRYFNVFGPRQDPDSDYAAVIPAFLKAALERRPPTVYGDGRQTRDFAYVADIVEANLLACRAAKSASGRAYNIGCGQETHLLGLIQGIASLVGHPVRPALAPPRSGDVRRSVASIDRARRELGYEPKVALPEGLRRTFDWLRRQKENERDS